jgi:hypothetical protein
MIVVRRLVSSWACGFVGLWVCGFEMPRGKMQEALFFTAESQRREVPQSYALRALYSLRNSATWRLGEMHYSDFSSGHFRMELHPLTSIFCICISSVYSLISVSIKNPTLLVLCTLLAWTNFTIAQTPLSSKVEMYKGRPTIMINGRPEYASIYALTDVPGGRWSWEELPSHNMKSFCSRGFRLVQVDLFLDHVWKEDGTIVLDTAQRQLRGVLNNCQDAAIMIRFHVNPPKWWQKKYPGENTVYADVAPMKDSHGLHRIIEDDEENPDRFSLASKKWIDEASAKTKEFLQKLQSTSEGNAVFAIQVASGVYGEWHYWGFINNEPDMSASMLGYFRDWLKTKYKTDANLRKAWNDAAVSLASASIPSMDERRFTKSGIFRDPQKERKIIDYYEAQQTVIADDIIHFCKLVKETWTRPIITGAFYGYFYAVFGREAAGGHLELQRVLKSPHVDFL